VGSNISAARYYLRNFMEVRVLLQSLSAATAHSTVG